jgi:mRNA interferase MazF
MRGKVVLVRFPFDDLSASKVRPAVCLTEAIRPHQHVVLAFITSQPLPQPLAFDLIIEPTHPDFGATGLRVRSAIRLHRLMTVSSDVLLRDLGVLSPPLQGLSIFSRARPLRRGSGQASRRRQGKAAPQGEPLSCCFQRRFRFALRRPHLFGAVSKGLLAVYRQSLQQEVLAKLRSLFALSQDRTAVAAACGQVPQRVPGAAPTIGNPLVAGRSACAHCRARPRGRWSSAPGNSTAGRAIPPSVPVRQVYCPDLTPVSS